LLRQQVQAINSVVMETRAEQMGCQAGGSGSVNIINNNGGGSGIISPSLELCTGVVGVIVLLFVVNIL
jgi:hypothetical protein